MPRDSADLTPGSVLHIKGFSSRGHSPRNKYFLILGKQSESMALAFIVSSQLHYLQSNVYKKEVVRIPARATHFLSHESIIQCFVLEPLPVDKLSEDFETKLVTNEGRRPARYLHEIRAVVQNSMQLSREDIEQVLKVLGP